MKKYFLVTAFLFLSFAYVVKANNISSKLSLSTSANEYETSVTFPAGYAIGDYIEFVKINPAAAGASGFYQISISYTRNSVASAATHLAAISHANPDLWRETGRINNNPYVGSRVNFTIDCNTQYGNSRFRIRAIDTWGVNTDPLTVNVKVTSLNMNETYTALNTMGTDLTVFKFLPMTSDWDLYVGDVFSSNGANLAIKALQNGNVGIGTSIPDEKLTVNGTIHATEVKVTQTVPADYVFQKYYTGKSNLKSDYVMPTLAEIESFTKKNHHLPNVPSAQEVQQKGVSLGEMSNVLLQKVEELTLYIIELKKENDELKTMNKKITEIEQEIKILKHEKSHK